VITVCFDETMYNNIVNAVSQGHYSIPKISKKLGIPYTTLHNYCYPTETQLQNKDTGKIYLHAQKLIKSAIEEGKNRFHDEIKSLCTTSFVKLVKGHSYKEKRVKTKNYMGAEEVETTITTKKVQPNAACVMFGLERTDPRFQPTVEAPEIPDNTIKIGYAEKEPEDADWAEWEEVEE